MDKPLISLCMIVKDEENYLPRCLESVKEVVDELIVVDTGSTDRTIEIAQRYGAIIYEFEWINDFSAARNFSLDKATGRWILVLDADEELEQKTGPRLRELAQLDRADAYWIIQRNFYKNRIQHSLDVPLLRFFRNNPNYRYRKRYHEDNTSSIKENGGKIAGDEEGLLIFHDGYMRHSAQGKPRVERAIQTMQQALCDEANNAWLMAKLGLELYSINRLEEAYHYLYQFVTADPKEMDFSQVNLLDTHEALAYLGDLAIRRKEYTLAKNCGIAGRQLTNVFELRLYSEFAYICGTLGETQVIVEQIQQTKSPLLANPADLSLLRQKLQELKELEKEIEALRNGFYTLLTSSQRNLLRSWKHDCRQLIQILQHLTQTAEPHT